MRDSFLTQRLRALFALGAGDIQTLGGGFSGSTNVVTTQISGRTDGVAPSAGKLGELLNNNQPSGSAVSLTTATPANVISLFITAGEWDMWGTVSFNLTGATATQLTGGGSTTTATLPTQPGTAGVGPDALFVESLPTATLTGVITRPFFSFFRISATTQLFMVAQATFSVGTISVYGSINCRRVG